MISRYSTYTGLSRQSADLGRAFICIRLYNHAMISSSATAARTKIVATIGPACRNEEVLRGLIRAGMDVARLNMSHGTHAEHAADITAIRRLAAEAGAPVAIIADLQGPKLRIGALDPDPLVLMDGTTVVLASSPGPGEIPLPHPELIAGVHSGDRLLLDDGEIELRVEDKGPGRLVCRVIAGGLLYSHKGIAAPGGTGLLDALTEKDRNDARFALEHGVDYLALSFVRAAADIRALRELVEETTGDRNAVGIIAKIEKREALDNFDAILEESDAVMVARGDLGVEISVEEVPLVQKKIIRRCNRAGIPVITATQMLQSMVTAPRPTRAEASDVANAILDGTDAVMLSGETAVGRYPVRAVEVMDRIARIVEPRLYPRSDDDFERLPHRHPITDAISDATARIADELAARLIVTSTFSGYTARQVARERPRVPIVALTPSAATCRRLTLVWGVQPIQVPEYGNTDEMLKLVRKTLLDRGLAEKDDLVVVTGGLPIGGGGKTNFLKVHRL